MSTPSPLSGYINSTYLDIVVTHPIDSSPPIYGKRWKITESSSYRLSGKIFVILSDGRILNVKGKAVGTKRLEEIDGKREKILCFDAGNYFWNRRYNKPQKIQVEQELVGSDYHYRLSKAEAVKLIGFSPLMQFYLRHDETGSFLKLTPHADNPIKQTIIPPLEGVSPCDCLCLKPGRLHIPGTKDRTSQTVKLAFEAIQQVYVE